MENMSNAAKAICMVLGGLALVGLLVITGPIWMGLGALAVGLLEIFLPIVLIVIAIVIVYNYLKNR